MRMLRGIIALVVLALIAMQSAPASAIGLDAARAKGLVGETLSGYLAPVSKPSGDVQKLVDRVNSGRRDHYRSIARRNGVGVEEIGRLTAQKLINALPSGAYYQASNGRWRRK